MLRGTPGCRRINPSRSRVSTIWWTEGGADAEVSLHRLRREAGRARAYKRTCWSQDLPCTRLPMRDRRPKGPPMSSTAAVPISRRSKVNIWSPSSLDADAPSKRRATGRLSRVSNLLRRRSQQRRSKTSRPRGKCIQRPSNGCLCAPTSERPRISGVYGWGERGVSMKEPLTTGFRSRRLDLGRTRDGP
jgi:hypothetical protein